MHVFAAVAGFECDNMAGRARLTCHKQREVTFGGPDIHADRPWLNRLDEPIHLRNFVDSAPCLGIADKVEVGNHPLHGPAKKLGFAHPFTEQDAFNGLCDGRHKHYPNTVVRH